MLFCPTQPPPLYPRPRPALWTCSDSAGGGDRFYRRVEGLWPLHPPVRTFPAPSRDDVSQSNWLGAGIKGVGAVWG